MSDFTVPKMDRYHIIDQLGEGGMATVYKAYDDRLKREVAIKFIRRGAVPPELLETVLKRFEREAISLAKLTHPNIVPVIDYGDYEGLPYLVMVYLQGGTLKTKTGHPIVYSQAARWLAPIARALDYAHRRNLIHRDVKPGNILFTEDGEPMLTDFGIAKILDVETSTSLTGTGVGIGTPKYMAPEQWMGKVLPQTDQYSLGVVLFELVTGRPPYDADTTTAILIKQTTEPLPHPKEFVPDLPDEVVQVLFTGLAKNPAERYPDMGKFAAVLEALKELRKEEVQEETIMAPGAGVEQHQTQGLGQVSEELAIPPVAKTVTRKTPPPEMKVAASISTPSSTAVERLGSEDRQADVAPEQVSQSMLRSEEGLAQEKLTLSLPFLMVGMAILGIFVVAIVGVFIFGPKLFSRTPSETITKQVAVAIPTVVMQEVTETQLPAGASTQTEASILTETPIQTEVLLLGIGSTQVSTVDNMEMVYVPAGDFLMGSNDGADDEKPQHQVSLDAFWIDKTEVTNAMYASCLQVGVCKLTASGRTTLAGFEKYPVVVDNLEMAQAYCEWAGRRLPTEAEWEKAARGMDGHTSPWGEGIKCEKANYGNCTGKVQPVGSYPSYASPYDVEDMAGNVWEWVADLYPKTSEHIIKGGDWQVLAWGMRSALRGGGGNICQKGPLLWGGSWDYLVGRDCSQAWTWEYRTVHASIGFRCALSP
jgi:serine/threonine protein kinase/formylglycine-generating enzyme required for sulfatase activity